MKVLASTRLSDFEVTSQRKVNDEAFTMKIQMKYLYNFSITPRNKVSLLLCLFSKALVDFCEIPFFMLKIEIMCADFLNSE